MYVRVRRDGCVSVEGEMGVCLWRERWDCLFREKLRFWRERQPDVEEYSGIIWRKMSVVACVERHVCVCMCKDERCVEGEAGCAGVCVWRER